MVDELSIKVIDKLNTQTSLHAQYLDSVKGNCDGHLILPNNQQPLKIVCIERLNQYNLVEYLQKLTLNPQNQDMVLISTFISPNQAKILKAHNKQFIDLAGNTFINTPQVYIDIQGKKKSTLNEYFELQILTGKAFQPKGMKLVLMLLLQPELINAPLRTIAKMSEISLGTAKQVVDDLIVQGFVVEKLSSAKKQHKELINIRSLLTKWLDAYPAKFAAKFSQEIYIARDVSLLQNLDLNPVEALWGGEYAAELWDNYLRAKEYLLYVHPDAKNDILKKARLQKLTPNVPNHAGHVRVIVAEPPLAINKIKDLNRPTVHKYLIYANLLLSSDSRMIDAARRFFENHIA